MTALPNGKTSLGLGLAAFALLFATWAWALFGAPSDAHQGDVYRIIYLHVPSAFTAFSSSLVLFIVSLWALFKKTERAMLWGRATAEVGLVFTVLTLATGSIWGRPTWGTWWTWDARLTTTFLLALLYAGYLLLYTSLSSGPQRTKICAIMGILIFADVPIIYKSVTWWRTLHQPPSILREGGSTMAPEMLATLGLCLVGLLATASWLMWQRQANLSLELAIERESQAKLSSNH